MAIPPPIQVGLARKWGQKYGVDPRLLLAIGGHETQWGTTGAGRPSQGGYALGYGVTDSGILSKYAGLANQYMYGAKTLADWGVHGLADVMAGKAARWATDPAWEKGVQGVYQGLGGALPAAPAAPSAAPPSTFASVRTPAAPPWRASRQLLASLAPGLQATPQPFRVGTQPGFQPLPQTGKPPAFSELYAQTAPVKLPPFVGRRISVTHGAGGEQPGDTHAQGPNVPATPRAAGLVGIAAQQLGQPYVWGGESRREGGFDCSGLVDWAMRQQGYKGPRLTTYSIANLGRSVKGHPLQPGDLVLANNGDHVVIYAGNGRVIAAPHTGTNVQYQPLSKFNITDVRRV